MATLIPSLLITSGEDSKDPYWTAHAQAYLQALEFRKWCNKLLEIINIKFPSLEGKWLGLREIHFEIGFGGKA